MATVALVTGANRGIGFEVTRQLARNGMTVFLGARDAALGRAAAAQLGAENLDVRYIELDLARESTAEAAARAIGALKLLGYNTSKAAVNMLTIQLAYELRGTAIKVNSANPGYTATEMNGHRGHQTLEEGAAEPVRLALLPPDGPTGGFYERAASNPW